MHTESLREPWFFDRRLIYGREHVLRCLDPLWASTREPFGQPKSLPNRSEAIFNGIMFRTLISRSGTPLGETMTFKLKEFVLRSGKKKLLWSRLFTITLLSRWLSKHLKSQGCNPHDLWSVRPLVICFQTCFGISLTSTSTQHNPECLCAFYTRTAL